MKILHVADLHFRQQWFEWVAAQANHFDAICIAGDLLNIWIARDVSLRAQTKWVRDWARYRFKGRLFVSSGNHDWWTNEEVTDTDASGGWLRKLSRAEVTCDNHGASVGEVYFFCHAYAARAPFPHADGTLRLRAAQTGSPFATEFIRELHRRFYAQLPDSMRVATTSKGEKTPLMPGELRDRDVAVGNHIGPPHELVPELLGHFQWRYESADFSRIQSIIAIGASHHRLAWIHPFRDGNGRVVRLFSDAVIRHSVSMAAHCGRCRADWRGIGRSIISAWLTPTRSAVQAPTTAAGISANARSGSSANLRCA